MSFLHRELNIFPDLLALHQAQPERYPFLLESIVNATPESSSRHWDILFAFPGQRLELDKDGINTDGNHNDNIDFLDQLDHLWSREILPSDKENILPFTGGWFLYLGYELAQQIENTLRLRAVTHAAEPRAMAVRCPAAILRDHLKQRIILVAEQGYEDCLNQLFEDIEQLHKSGPENNSLQRPFEITDLQEESADIFLDSVDRIKDYIKEGDVFQVNLSRLWQARTSGLSTGSDLYRILRQKNPSPFAGLCTTPEWSIISSSPERLIAVNRERTITTRPIAGTHPRCENTLDDHRLSMRLLQHPKEQAEHIMLIDLERNDLGRVCKPGSVKVDELMTLESYTHVHHIVSNIEGKLHENFTPGEIIRAVFPGGTITGCPKVRCMEIIAELEQQARGCYTGAMGYLNRDGSMDLNILIRSFSLYKNELKFRAGAGIVNDSIPLRELDETRAKAIGLLLALGKSEAEIRSELGWDSNVDQRPANN